MEIIFGVLMGIFVGIACAGYMFIQPLADRDKTITEQKDENLQICDENKELRAEVEDISFELSTAYKEIELKDKQIECIKAILEQNNYSRDDIKIAKLKELVADWKAN